MAPNHIPKPVWKGQNISVLSSKVVKWLLSHANAPWFQLRSTQQNYSPCVLKLASDIFLTNKKTTVMPLMACVELLESGSYLDCLPYSFEFTTQSLEAEQSPFLCRNLTFHIHSFSKCYFSTYCLSVAMLVTVELDINMGNILASKSSQWEWKSRKQWEQCCAMCYHRSVRGNGSSGRIQSLDTGQLLDVIRF